MRGGLRPTSWRLQIGMRTRRHPWNCSFFQSMTVPMAWSRMLPQFWQATAAKGNVSASTPGTGLLGEKSNDTVVSAQSMIAKLRLPQHEQISVALRSIKKLFISSRETVESFVVVIANSPQFGILACRCALHLKARLNFESIPRFFLLRVSERLPLLIGGLAFICVGTYAIESGQPNRVIVLEKP